MPTTTSKSDIDRLAGKRVRVSRPDSSLDGKTGVVAVYHPVYKSFGVALDHRQDNNYTLLSPAEWRKQNWLVFRDPPGYIDGFRADELTVIGEGVTSKTTDYPHTCPMCKAPAYVGFMTVECSKGTHK
jgi:hypothetical protein